MTVYISGAIAGTEDYRERFEEAENALRERGYEVINPVKVFDTLQDVLSYNEKLQICMTLVEQADAICSLPDWSSSKGASAERFYAIALDKVCFLYFCGEAHRV